MNDNYNPNSVNAVLSRIETKLNNSLEAQEDQARSIGKLWAAIGRIDVRVAAISGGVSGVIIFIKLLFFNH